MNIYMVKDKKFDCGIELNILNIIIKLTIEMHKSHYKYNHHNASKLLAGDV